jgi:hypothetical protein
MRAWVISWIVFCAVGLVFPAALLVFEWRPQSASHGLLGHSVIAVVVLALALIAQMRWRLWVRTSLGGCTYHRAVRTPSIDQCHLRYRSKSVGDSK